MSIAESFLKETKPKHKMLGNSSLRLLAGIPVAGTSVKYMPTYSQQIIKLLKALLLLENYDIFE